MTDKSLKNLYARLRPDERFRLSVEAIARDGGHEFAALSGSCPVHRYYATDAAYRSRFFAAAYIALSATNLLLRADRDWPEKAPTGERQELDDLYRARVAAVLGICEGFERFCHALAVEPAKLLALEPNCLPGWHSAGRLRGKGIASDSVMEEAVYRWLEGLWRGMVDDQESERQGFIER